MTVAGATSLARVPRWSLELSIGGEAVAGREEPVAVFDPATEMVLASLPQANAGQVDAAVAAARAAFDQGPWPRIAGAERAAIMERFADRLATHQADLVAGVVSEVGTPINQTESGQVGLPIDVLRVYAELARRDRTENLGPNFDGIPSDSLVAYVPVGVVVVLTAYNYPLLLALRTMGGALAAGCTVVLMPSPKAPLTTLLLARAAEEAGFPAGVINVVVGGPAVGRRLSSHPAVDKVAFTGSRAVGRMVMEQAAGTIKSITLELGGKSPLLVLPGYDARPFARRMHTRYLLNAGQGCAAPARILVQKDYYKEFIEVSRDALAKIRVGDPWDPKTIVGPLIRPEHRDSVEKRVADAVAAGAEVVAGGGRPDLERGWYMNPVLLGGLDNRDPVAQEELFGPVGVVLTYSDVDDAVRQANDVAYGLSADVYSSDLKQAMGVARRLRAGSVYINGGGAFRTDAPFGGFKASGVGREYGEWGVREFLQAQHIQWTLS